MSSSFAQSQISEELCRIKTVIRILMWILTLLRFWNLFRSVSHGMLWLQSPSKS